MADISTSQSDSSEFTARSVGVCEPRDQLPRRSQKMEDAGASTQAQPAEQSHQSPVWLLKPRKQMRLDKNESPAGSALGGGSERGRQLSDGKSKGTGRRGRSGATR